MKATIDSARWSMDSSGEWLCLKTKDARKIIDGMKPGKPYDLEIKEHRERRSLDSNAYCWVMLDKLAERMNLPKTEIYKGYIREIGGNSDTVCIPSAAVEKFCESWTRNGLGWQTVTFPSKLTGCTNVTVYYGSSTYDKEQMSRLIDMVVQDCKSVGIETMTPAELERMLSQWEAREPKH